MTKEKTSEDQKKHFPSLWILHHQWRKIFRTEISTTYSCSWGVEDAFLLCNVTSILCIFHCILYVVFAFSSVWWSSYQKDGCLLRRCGYVHSSTQMCCKWILMGSWACLSTNLRARACAMHWNDCPASAQICWNALLLYQSLFLGLQQTPINIAR